MPTRLGTRCLLVSAADVGAGSGSLITRSAESKLMWIRPGPNRYWPQANSAPEKLGSCQYPSLATAGRVQVFDFCTGNLTARGDPRALSPAPVHPPLLRFGLAGLRLHRHLGALKP